MKQLIIKYLKKQFKTNYIKIRDNYVFYLFLRWLAELVSNHDNTIYVCNKIADYIYLNNLLSIEFTDIFVVDNVAILFTRRPGLWIGKKGCIIEEIAHMLNVNDNEEEIHNYTIDIIEDLNSARVNISKEIKILNLI